MHSGGKLMHTGEEVRWTKDRLLPSDPRNDSAGRWSEKRPFYWEKVVYTVPADVSNARVHEQDAHFRNKGGRIMEDVYGLTVLAVDGPHRDKGLVARMTTDQDRQRYFIWYKVTRPPVSQRFEIPDADVPMYEAAGYRLDS